MGPPLRQACPRAAPGGTNAVPGRCRRGGVQQARPSTAAGSPRALRRLLRAFAALPRPARGLQGGLRVYYKQAGCRHQEQQQPGGVRDTAARGRATDRHRCCFARLVAGSGAVGLAPVAGTVRSSHTREKLVQRTAQLHRPVTAGKCNIRCGCTRAVFGSHPFLCGRRHSSPPMNCITKAMRLGMVVNPGGVHVHVP